MTAEYPPTRPQRRLTIVTEVVPAEVARLTELLQRPSSAEVFESLPGVHFLSFVVLPHDARPRLVFEASFDGPPAEFLRATYNNKPVQSLLRAVYGACPEALDFTEEERFVRSLQRKDQKGGLFYNAMPGITVAQIERDRAVHDSVAKHLDAPRHRMRGRSVAAAFQSVWSFANDRVDLLGVLKTPRRPFRVRHGPELAAAFGTACLSALLAVTMLSTGLLGVGSTLSRGTVATTLIFLALAGYGVFAIVRGSVETNLRLRPAWQGPYAVSGRLLLLLAYLVATWNLLSWPLIRNTALLAAVGIVVLVFAVVRLDRRTDEQAVVRRLTKIASAGFVLLLALASFPRLGDLAQASTAMFMAIGALVLFASLSHRARVRAGNLVSWLRLVAALIIVAQVALLGSESLGTDTTLTLLRGGRIVLALVVISVTVAVLVVCAIRRREEADQEIAHDLVWDDHDHIRADEAARDGVQQHVAVLVRVKAGRLRLRVLQLTLRLIGLAHSVIRNRGRFGGLTTIHFARWLVIDGIEPGERQLLFLSNYDGSWDRYLSDFVDHTSSWLTAIWGHTELVRNGRYRGGFPRPRWLILGGARYEERFKTFARVSQVRTLLWYRAYPDLTVDDLQNNLALREQLLRLRTGAVAVDALRRIGVR